MKVLRILRRRKIKLSFVLLLLLFFIFNSYAWFSMQKDTEIDGLLMDVKEWAIEFWVDDEEIKEDLITIDVDEFYPGIDPIEKVIDIYNTGEVETNLKYEIDSIYLYGQKIVDNETVGEESTDENGITKANLFGNIDATIFDEKNTNYDFSLKYPTPFEIVYSYDKVKMKGATEDNTEKGYFKLNLKWDNDENNNIEDTKIGNLVYDYRTNNNTEEAALQIVVKITATRGEYKKQ